MYYGFQFYFQKEYKPWIKTPRWFDDANEDEEKDTAGTTGKNETEKKNIFIN